MRFPILDRQKIVHPAGCLLLRDPRRTLRCHYGGTLAHGFSRYLVREPEETH